MVGDAHHQRHIVLDQDDGEAGVGEPAQDRAQRGLVGAHQAGGGLVEQQHGGCGCERAGDLHQAPVDVSKLARGHVQRSGVADEGEEPLGDALVGRCGGAGHGIAEPAAAQTDQHVVEHAERGEELGGLVGAGDARSRRLPGRSAGQLPGA